LPPRKDYVSLLNIAEGPAINARAVAQGNAAGVLHDVFPGPDGKSVVMELKLTRPDGTEYLAPATTGKSTDPKDNQVQLFPIATMAERLGTTVEGMRMILAAQSAAGSTAAVDHYNTYKDSRQALNDQVTVKNMEDYASDGKNLVSKNEYLKMSADQRARFVPLKQIDIDMKERQLNATISAANKPGELEKRIAQIRSMKLSPEEEKAALLQIALGAKPGMTESQAIMTLMRMDAHNDKKSEKETKYALQLDEVLSSTGGEVNAQNLNRVNILRKANGLPLMEKVNVKGGKKGLMWDSDTVEFREKDAPTAAGGLPTQSQPDQQQQGKSSKENILQKLSQPTGDQLSSLSPGKGLSYLKPGASQQPSQKDTDAEDAYYQAMNPSAKADTLADQREKEDWARLNSNLKVVGDGVKKVSSAAKKAYYGEDAKTIEELNARAENLSKEEFIRQFKAIKAGTR